MWTDGLKLTKSSRATTYPVVLQLNELSPHARKKHLLLAGLWVADEHPDMNTILQPIVNELRNLFHHGIRWRPNAENEVISRFIVVIFTADSLAKADVLKTKRFNGENGCPACLAPGEEVNNKRVYAAIEHLPRTDESIRYDGLAAFEQGRPVRGIKGVSSLATLPLFNLVDGVVVDPAHNPFLGVARRLVERYLTDADEQWYIGQGENIAAIDVKLTSIRPPTRNSRQPRSIVLYRMWKISEWRNWLLYYALPCLDGILRLEYFNHLALLCEAIYILNSCNITEAKLDRADVCIKEFIQRYQTLFGLNNMLFNVHLLGHLVESVRNWGPLWVFSALPFESFNNKILNYIKSPFARASQILTRFFLKKFIIVAAQQIPLSIEAKEEAFRLLKINNDHVEGMPEGHYFQGLGRCDNRLPQLNEVNCIRAAGYRLRPRRRINFYNRAVINGTEYRVADNRRRKVCNHIVFCQQSRFFIIEKLVSYRFDNQQLAGFIGMYLHNVESIYRVPHMQRVTRVEVRYFISFNDVISPGFYIPSDEESAAVSLSNVWETD